VLPFVRGSLGYQDLSVGLPVLDENDTVRSDWRSRGIDVGAGLNVPLHDEWTLMPTLHLGLADMSNKADYSASLLGPVLKPVFEGIVFDWNTKAWIAGGGIALR
jgi:hypothetical protein